MRSICIFLPCAISIKIKFQRKRWNEVEIKNIIRRVDKCSSISAKVKLTPFHRIVDTSTIFVRPEKNWINEYDRIRSAINECFCIFIYWPLNPIIKQTFFIILSEILFSFSSIFTHTLVLHNGSFVRAASWYERNIFLSLSLSLSPSFSVSESPTSASFYFTQSHSPFLRDSRR